MTCHYSLLDEPLIRTRLVAGGQPQTYTLPGLFVALGKDEIRDFPALRPHQRHPWHAFLVQLAAIAMHRAETTEPFASETTWRDALLALTPEDPDGAAWCLVSPPDRPGFMQAPSAETTLSGWQTRVSPDRLDMLITSKNHDVKAVRMVNCEPDDWLMSLISLQTQEGRLGAPKAGWCEISRMNKGFGSRTGIGVVPEGHWGRRWRRDVSTALEHRNETIELFGLCDKGLALLWVIPWDGTKSLSFTALDPFYIEVCRRVRLTIEHERLIAYVIGTSTPRIQAKQLCGQTGDAWTSIKVNGEKALTLSNKGFDYKLASELVFGAGTYRQPIAQTLREDDGSEGIVILAQGVTRGQGKTEGYHERSIPISPTARKMLIRHQTDRLAAIASERVKAIGGMRSVLWSGLVTLFNNGSESSPSDETKNKANRYAKPFELEEDHRFFTELNTEIEADDPKKARTEWLLAMKDRAETVLKRAFDAGPRCGEQRYRARAVALSHFEGRLRGDKSPLPDLRDHYREQKLHKEIADANP